MASISEDFENKRMVATATEIMYRSRARFWVSLAQVLLSVITIPLAYAFVAVRFVVYYVTQAIIYFAEFVQSSVLTITGYAVLEYEVGENPIQYVTDHMHNMKFYAWSRKRRYAYIRNILIRENVPEDLWPTELKTTNAANTTKKG